MENKEDLRITRTYKSLTEAFMQLMSEKRFEDITVNELCERAMIRRTTFYKHFADKYEFFRFFVRRLQTGFDEVNPDSADYIDPSSFFISIIRHVMHFLKDHESFVQMSLSSNLLPALLDMLSEQITFDIAEKIRIAVRKGLKVPASPEIIASFFTGAIVHTVRCWIGQKRRLPEEELIQEVGRILMVWSLS